MLFLTIFYSVLFFLYGITIGSFLNVCILRIPLKETVVTTPSHCMSCGHRLAWYDLFPVFSFLFLGGKCRYCKAKISWQYPLVELLNGFVYVLTYFNLGVGDSVRQTIYTLIICIFLSAMIVLAGIDIREQIVPDKINLFIFVLGIIVFIIDLPFFGEPVGVTWYEHLIGMFVISLPMLLLMFFGAMGGGDMKLYAAAGFLIGWKNAVLSIILACIFGSIASIILMLAKKVKFGAKEHIPFVPFIALSMPVVIFWGTQMINWYINRYFVFD